MPRYQAPMPTIQPRQTGPLGQLGNFALQKGLQAGLDMYAPGAGTFAGEAAREILPGIVPRFNNGGIAGGDRDQFVQSRWGSDATWRPTEGQAGVFDVLRGTSGTGEAKRTGQFTDFSVQMMLDRAAEAEAAGDTETASKIKSAVAQAAAPRPSPRTKGTYDFHNIPLGQLGGADVSFSGGYTEREGAPDAYRGGLNFGWKFNEGGGVGSWLGWSPEKVALAKKFWGETLPDAVAGAPSAAAEAVSGALPSREDLGLSPEQLAATKRYFTESVPSGKFYNTGGMVHKDEKAYRMDHKDHLIGVQEYKNMGGKIGPLSKTVMKDKDGQMSERHYHNPLAAKPAGDKGGE